VHPCCYLSFFVVATLCVNKDVYIYILMIKQIFLASFFFGARCSNAFFSEWNGATYTKFGDDVGQSSAPQDTF